jgi:16S rRNA (cytidine1402-2'-O)-methyltransferase
VQEDSDRARGEFVLAVEGVDAARVARAALDTAQILETLLDEVPLKQAVRLTAKITGEARNALYEQALARKEMQQVAADRKHKVSDDP